MKILQGLKVEGKSFEGLKRNIDIFIGTKNIFNPFFICIMIYVSLVFLYNYNYFNKKKMIMKINYLFYFYAWYSSHSNDMSRKTYEILLCHLQPPNDEDQNEVFSERKH